MLSFAGSLKVFVAVEPCDMRKGFNDHDAAPVTAPLPARLQDRSLPSSGLLAHVLVSKNCDHLPLYRQEKIFARRHGVNLPRQTLARWVELAADRLQPVYRQIKSGVMSGGYVQVDETPIDYLDPGRGKRGQGYLFWTCASAQGDVVFHWEKPAAPPHVSAMCCPWTAPVLCSATATPPIRPSRSNTRNPSCSPAVGRMCSGSFTKPASGRPA